MRGQRSQRAETQEELIAALGAYRRATYPS